jgi:phosphoserine phosphatase
MPAYASVVIDVDSTLCGVEGIDFLAARRGPDVTAQIVALTDKAMKGEIPLETIYGHRLTMIRPTRADIVALAAEYERTLASGAAEAIDEMRAAGVRPVLVSGGIREAIAPVARKLGFDVADLHAVSLRFDEAGSYLDFDRDSPLTSQPGKPVLVRALIEEGKLPRPVLAVGDGATDAKLIGVVNRFLAFTGFARRTNVINVADGEVTSFAELARIVTAQA